MLQKVAPVFRTAVRHHYLWRPRWSRCGSSSTTPLNSAIDRMERDFWDMERQFFRPWFVRPWSFSLTSPSAKERFHWAQPIVEEDGTKKFKLLFDVSHFSPQEIDVKTSKGKLIVQGKHQSKNDGSESKHEYYREMTIPEGVKLDEMTCKYTDEGALVIEAPYTPTVQESKEQSIPIKHE